jgi:BirA family biotin operon repressor/biotin-[acetyl-CoA-carboxylase] ligase
MTSPSPARSRLDDAVLTRALRRASGGWRVQVVDETGSTNSDAALAARSGVPEGLVVLAESQTAGRGRLGRSWQSPSRAGIMCSVLLRPTVSIARWGWLPLLTGVALAEAVRETCKLDAVLKWPNDLLIGGRKCAGVLAEAPAQGQAAGSVVVGVGLNVDHVEDELPVSPTGLPATSLRVALRTDRTIDRTALAAELLLRLRDWYDRWQAAQGDPDRSGVRQAYLDSCSTLGRTVRVILPGDEELIGEATTVDRDGQLVVLAGGGVLRSVAAGDVLHLRA